MSFRRNRLMALIFAMGIFFSQGELNAASEEYAFSHEIDSYIRYIPARSTEAMSGEVEIIEANSEYSFKLKLFDKLPVKFSLDNHYIGIEDTVIDVELPAHLIGLTTDIETTLPFFDVTKTYLRIGLSPSFYGDDYDFEASAFRLNSRFIFIYIPNDKWTFLAGAALYPDFEAEILPVLGFIYKPNDKLIFNIIPKRPNISYLLNEKVTLFVQGGGSLNNEFEVTRGSSNNVVLRYREIHLGGGFKIKLNKFIQASLSAGAVFSRSLKYRDNQGEVNIKDAIFTEFRTQMQF